MGVALAYLLGNVMFLQAIKLQRVLEVRICIMSSFSFATGLTLALGGSLYRGPREPVWAREEAAHANSTHTTEVDGSSTIHAPGFSWYLRLCVVTFIYMSVWCYRRLWSLYKPPPEELHPEDSCCTAVCRFLKSGCMKIFRAIVTLCAMGFVWILLFIGFTFGGDEV